MKFLIALFSLFIFSSYLHSAEEKKSLQIKKSDGTIKIDGELDESDWQNAQKADNFWQKYPFDSSLAVSKTEVFITYDQNFLYVGAICYDDNPKDYVVQSLKRDFNAELSDGFFVIIDPFSDLTNGFSFGVNPHGAQWEGMLQYGGNMGVSTNWDNKWFSEVKSFPNKGYWSVEMAIPFKTLRFNEGNQEWRINFARHDLKHNEVSVWCKVPRNFSISSLAFTGALRYEESPTKNGGNVAIIPYGITTISSDYLSNETTNIKPNVGLDAKIAVTSALNLDLTVNPDFAQVDVDRQVTNLSRFNLFFPERRNFFLENSDLFERFGFRQIRPFFSRRIGLNNGLPVPILFGARLSGKLNEKWRIGLMSMQTEGGSQEGLQGQNYSVAAATYHLKGRSNISGIFVNRQGFDKNNVNWPDYNRIAGIDWNIASMNNKLLGKVFFHHSFSPTVSDNSFAHASWIHYEDPKLMLEWNHEYVGHNYNAEVGFVPRNSFYNPNNDQIEKRSYWRLEPVASYTFYPKSSIINNHGADLYLSEYLDGSFNEMERLLKVGYAVNFQNSAVLLFGALNNAVQLYFPQDITFSGNNPLDSGKYNFNNFKISYESNNRKKLSFYASADYGTYFIGEKFTGVFWIGFRKQPWGIFSLDLEYNTIKMPDNFSDVEFWLIGPKIELSFTRKLFFTTIVQYNTQINNLNTYTRLQWRFRPMSDLFIVYSENYNSYNIAIKNRSLAVKLVWWINL